MAARGRGWPADVLAKRRTSGRLEGSIIAASITCHASRKTGSAIHSGVAPSISPS